MRILVTGASGFLGGHLAGRLARDGHTLVLQGSSTTPSAEPPHRAIRTGPLESFSDWNALLDGVDLVVNLAGRAHVMKETAANAEQAFNAANAEAVARLVEAMQARGIASLVHISSIAAKLTINAYGRSKLAGEAVVQDWCRRTGARAAILRPPLIFGPGAPGNMARLVSLIRTGLPLPFASVANRRSMLAVENATDAIAAVAANGVRPGCTVYELCDDDVISLPQVVRAIAAGMGRPARLVPFPAPLLRSASWFVSRALSDGLFGDLVLDNAPFRADFGWKPVVGTRAALEAMGRHAARSNG